MFYDVNWWEVGYYCCNKVICVGFYCLCVGGGNYIVYVFGFDILIDNYYIGIFLRRKDNDINIFCNLN